MPADVVNLAKALVSSGVSIPDPDLREEVNKLASREDEKSSDKDDKDESVKSSSSTTTGSTDTKKGGK